MGRVTVILALLSTTAVSAQVHTWTGAVNTTWDTTTANWSSSSGGSLWVNGPTSEAIIQAPNTHITVNEQITLRQLTMSNGNSFLEGTGSLVFVGPTSRIWMPPPGQNIFIRIPIYGTDGLRVDSDDFGLLFLSAECHYIGPTIITGNATLYVDLMPSLPVDTNVFVDADAGLVLRGGFTQQIRTLTGGGRVSAVLNPSTLVITGSPEGATFRGGFYTPGGQHLTIRKIGTGTQTLASESTYNDGVSIEGGTLISGGNIAFGGGMTTVADGATWGLQDGISMDVDNSVVGAGAAGRRGAIDNISGDNAIAFVDMAGPTTIGATAGSLSIQNLFATVHLPTFNVAANATINTFGIIGTGGMTKTGPGTLTFNLPNTWTGILTVQEGTISIDVPGGFSLLEPTSLTMGSSLPNQVRLNGEPCEINRLEGGGAASFVTNGSTTSPATAVLNVSTGVTAAFGGTFSDGPPGSAPLALTKTGPGRQIFTGVQTFTGPCTLIDGTLTAHDSITSPSVFVSRGTLDGNGDIIGAVTLNLGGTLSGQRNIAGHVALTDGVLRPGNGVGTMYMLGGLSAVRGTMEFEMALPNYDQIVAIDSDVSLGGGLVALSIIPSGTPAGPQARYYIIRNFGAGSTTGTFSGLPEGSLIPALAGFGGFENWYIHYGADSDTGALSGGNDVAITPDGPQPIVANGSFERGTSMGTLPIGSTNIASWVVTRGSVDWFDGWQSADGARSVDLQGQNASGGVQQLIQTEVGQRYRLTFALAGNPDGGAPIKHMRVRADNEFSGIFAFDTTGRTFQDMGWRDETFYFYAHGDLTNIELYSTDSPSSWGAVVDNVRVELVPCPGDVNSSGSVDLSDLATLLAHFGTAGGAGLAEGDLDGDGDVSLADLAILLAHFGSICV